MDKEARIFIAGHMGMVGTSIVKKLRKEGYQNVIGRSSAELDLRNQNEVLSFFQAEKPEYVFLAAAKVGGILANSKYRAEFLYDNLQLQLNVIHQSYLAGVKKLLFLGSSCIYPKEAPQPLKEEYLLTGLLEPSNEPYAIAKIAGVKMCDAYRAQYGSNFVSVMPTNLYGPNDNYDLERSHVIPALIRKFHHAKTNGINSVHVWGTGRPLREFMHVDDLADACLFLMQHYNEPSPINVGSGEELTIAKLAELIAEIVGYKGQIKFDVNKPDGTYQKFLSNSKLEKLGWKSSISLIDGLKMTYQSFMLRIDEMPDSKVI